MGQRKQHGRKIGTKTTCCLKQQTRTGVYRATHKSVVLNDRWQKERRTADDKEQEQGKTEENIGFLEMLGFLLRRRASSSRAHSPANA